MAKAALIIPARSGSTRFPGKPMALIQGKELLFRTWTIANAVSSVDEVYIATDDEKIYDFALKFGAKVLMTRKDCENGTERTFDAIEQLPVKPEIAINLQGDAVLTPPWVVQAVVEKMKKNPAIEMATPATHLPWNAFDQFVKGKEGGRTSGTLVVFDVNSRALYFSKGIIPHLRGERGTRPSPFYRHIGLYGYRYSALKRYVGLKPTPLEQVEKLEQLRALENGIPIEVVLVDYQGRTHWSVDNPEDIAVVEEIIKKEGELVLWN